MKFVLVFITAAMSHGPANLGQVPYRAAFGTVAQVYSAEVATSATKAGCIPDISGATQ